MLKKLSYTLLLCALLLLAACGNPSSPVSETPSDISEVTSVTAEASTSQLETTATETTAPEAAEAEPQNTPSAANSTAGTSSKQTESAKANSTTTSKSTPPAQTQPAPTTPPTASTTPAPTEPPKPAFNVNEYVDYAKSYGQGIGLIYDTSIGNGNWNAPQGLYPALSDSKMREGIRIGCDRVKRDGAES